MTEAPDLDPKLDLDLDAEAGLETEAKARPIAIKVGGRTIEFPPMKTWPWDAHEAIGEGELMEAMGIVLDEDDVAHLRKQSGENVLKIIAHLSKVSGVNPGDFNRSGRRSRTTPRR